MKHGQTGTSTYRAWLSMWSRCTNPKDQAHADYGLRGITVCKRWKSFANFLKDLGPRPVGTRLDRRNVNKGYTPKNVAWVDVQTSNLNRRVALYVVWFGERHFLKDVAALHLVPYSTAKWRLQQGWPIEQILRG